LNSPGMDRNCHDTAPISAFYGTEIAYAPKKVFSACPLCFSGRTVRQKLYQRKPKQDQYKKASMR